MELLQQVAVLLIPILLTALGGMYMWLERTKGKANDDAHAAITSNINRVESEVKEFRKEYKEDMSRINGTLSEIKVSIARMEERGAGGE